MSIEQLNGATIKEVVTMCESTGITLSINDGIITSINSEKILTKKS